MCSNDINLSFQNRCIQPSHVSNSRLGSRDLEVNKKDMVSAARNSPV